MRNDTPCREDGCAQRGSGAGRGVSRMSMELWRAMPGSVAAYILVVLGMAALPYAARARRAQTCNLCRSTKSQ